MEQKYSLAEAEETVAPAVPVTQPVTEPGAVAVDRTTSGAGTKRTRSKRQVVIGSDRPSRFPSLRGLNQQPIVRLPPAAPAYGSLVRTRSAPTLNHPHLAWEYYPVPYDGGAAGIASQYIVAEAFDASWTLSSLDRSITPAAAPTGAAAAVAAAAADLELGEEDGSRPSDETAREKAAEIEQPQPAPNGGLRAWSQVLGSFFLFFSSWGSVNTFGVFQTYYEEQAAWHQSPSDIAWIGSIQAFLLLLVGAVSGPLYDAGYFRCLIVTGTVLIPLGFFMTSICTTYWQTLLAQGVCIGLGNGCLFVPGLAILPQYFTTKNALATGIAATGTSVGGIVLPIVWTNLVEQVGFAWATRALGFITLAALVTSLAVMKPRLTPKARRRLFDLSALKELPYLFYSVGSFFAFVGYIVPTVYLEAFAIETGITGQSFGFYLLAIMNGASIAGRVIPTIFAFYFGPLNSMAVIEILAGGLTFAWIAITTSLPGTIIYAVLYGFLSGGFAALLPVGVFTLTPDLRTMGTRMGQVMFIGAFGVLIGAPVSGAIQTSAASWVGLKSFAGGVMVLAAGFWVCARVAKSGWSLRTRA